MAVKHATIKPIRHAGVASQDRVYISGGAITEGAPVVFSSGKVVEATDAAGGAAGPFVGIALNSTTAANQDVMVALALPGRRFVASLGSNSSSGQSDDGSHALALTDIGALYELHKDATTGKWLVGADSTGANAAARITALVDKVGATTNDALSFGESGSGPGVGGTPPNATFTQDPVAGPNFGTARVEFTFKLSQTIYG
jgi:hypothetical protein